MRQTTSANTFLVIFVLIALHAAPNYGQPIQNEPAEATEPTNDNGGAVDSATIEAAEVPAEAPAEATPAEYLVVSPQWLGDDELVADQDHIRPVRHIGFGGIGGGFAGGFPGGVVSTPVYSVPLVQTVPIVTTVPVVSTIATYPTYATSYGYGGYSPIGFGGLGFGKFRSRYSVKGFGLGGGFLG